MWSNMLNLFAAFKRPDLGFRRRDPSTGNENAVQRCAAACRSPAQDLYHSAAATSGARRRAVRQRRRSGVERPAADRRPWPHRAGTRPNLGHRQHHYAAYHRSPFRADGTVRDYRGGRGRPLVRARSGGGLPPGARRGAGSTYSSGRHRRLGGAGFRPPASCRAA